MSPSDARPGCYSCKVVAITGGTSGIGLALVDAFLAAGASVVTSARSAEAKKLDPYQQPGKCLQLRLRDDLNDIDLGGQYCFIK